MAPSRTPLDPRLSLPAVVVVLGVTLLLGQRQPLLFLLSWGWLSLHLFFWPVPLKRFRPLLLLFPLLLSLTLLLLLTETGGATWELQGLTLHESGARRALFVILKSLLSLTTLLWLTSATSQGALLEGLRFYRVPHPFLALLEFTFRYFTLMGQEMTRMRRAAKSRGYGGGSLLQVGLLGQLVGALFVRSYNRGEAINRAMVSRGLSGEYPFASLPPPGFREALYAALNLLFLLLLLSVFLSRFPL